MQIPLGRPLTILVMAGFFWFGPNATKIAWSKPTDADVDLAIRACSVSQKIDAEVEGGLNVLKRRLLSGEGKVSYSEIPSVIGSSVATDAAKITLFDKIQDCVIKRVYGSAEPKYKETITRVKSPSNYTENDGYGSNQPFRYCFYTVNDERFLPGTAQVAVELNIDDSGPDGRNVARIVSATEKEICAAGEAKGYSRKSRAKIKTHIEVDKVTRALIPAASDYTVYGPNVRITSGGTHDGHSPFCQKRAVQSCAKPEHGGALVPGTGKPVDVNTAGRVGSSVVVDSPEQICIEFWASTTACETEMSISGRAAAVERVTAIN